ncbi:hypothetical protein BDB00DRAFT_836865 [Zychaea mexicana]|uniref:uncharacterized protein n=1 Tax=Zychaea mexicana TaxID=64656 RepID=UPI0022FDD00F|nr:uncharacterized protein BDB00DRAFT_836865 [Zychaea mexicana]KAI9490674.1 hypothetical protein BDB00DRAFT_836865 [Zychaea mexicana]
MTARGVARSIKNYAKGFSEAQIKVREATSNDPGGPSGIIMNEVAQLTYNEHDFVEIMDMIDRRLNDKGKNWRHVFKALLVLDYCLHVGSENVVLYAKENVYVIKTLKEFQHLDDNGRDVGANVRQKAKDITSLLLDDARLKEERQSRNAMRDRMAGVGDYMNESLYGRGYDGTMTFDRPSGPRYTNGNNNNSMDNDEDRDLQRAMEESRRLAQSDSRDRNQDDEDLAKAIEMSEREQRERERKQREKLERDNIKNLLDDDTDLFKPVNVQQTGMTFSGVPLGAQQQQQQQQHNPYHWNQMQAQMTGMPQQYTGVAPFQTNPMMMSPQYTGFNTAMQTGAGFPSSANGLQSMSTGSLPNTMSPLNPQLTSMGSSPMSLNQSQAQQQTPVKTGSNNPFGPGYQQQQTASSVASAAATPVAIQSQTQTPVSAQQTGIIHQLSSSAPSAQPLPQQPLDPRHAKLNTLLANRDEGQDTFGNTGNLRVPVGTGFASSLDPQATGKANSTGDLLNLNNQPTGTSFPQVHNPFTPQYTGQPQQQSTGSLF